MISPALLAQVRRIEIVTGRLVSENFAGEYQSVFKGRGMEFAEVREYVPGDDVRSIDWNVTARTGNLFIRQYTEERELTVILACDLSGSQFFGTGKRLKNEVAAELAAVLAFSALQNNDKVGLFLFTENIEEHIPPKKGRQHILHVIRDLLAYTPRSIGTRIGPSLDEITKVVKRRSILFFISDFRDEGFEPALKRAAIKHDVVPVILHDPRESELPAVGAFLDLEDPETGRRVLLDARGRHDLSKIKQAEEKRRKGLEQLFGRLGLDSIVVGTDGSTIDPLVNFFRARNKRMRR